jgi:Pentapeptide repeats (8 copies)
MTAAAANQPGWDDEEKDLRRTEVRTGTENLRAQRLMARVQAAALTLALVASLAAAYAAYQAGQAVKASEQGMVQQATENQLTTAIGAIGGATTAEQVAGLTLLRMNVATQLDAALRTSDLRTRQTAYDAYATSLDVLAEYIRSGTTGTSPSFGPGYGIPRTQQPLSVVYATDELRLLLGMSSDVRNIASSEEPAIDLSHDELYGLPWSGVNIGWLSSAYMLKVDLRSADLANSRWSRSSFLVGAYLQCADLSGADFRGADLAGADLRGANISGADFAGAKLQSVKTDGAFGTAKGLNAAHAASSWNQSSCSSNRAYWDSPLASLRTAARLRPVAC